MKVYLAGAMEFAPDGGVGWRQLVTEMLDDRGAIYFNPCTDESRILKLYDYKNGKEFVESKIIDSKRFVKCMRELAEADLVEVRSADYVFVYITPGLGGGTAGELTCAKYIYNVPVVGVWHPDANLKETSGWLYSCCDIVFDTLEEAVDYIDKRYRES